MTDSTFEKKMAILNLAAELTGVNTFDPDKTHTDKIEEFFEIANRIEEFTLSTGRPKTNSEEEKRKAFLASLDANSCACGNKCDDC